ncbi:MAG: DNA polymerase III subunit epsilon [Steroidobacteraceae bacterium]|jgi:DNA polymerase-3 subunit epsilon
MRQIVLDTETTGLESSLGHRIIEIGCVELLNRRTSGRTYHRYLNPERDIDPAARAVHGISREQLVDKPKFALIAEELIQFIAGSELIIHNAVFDIAFLDAEFARVSTATPIKVGALCQVLDTLALAREMHPGQRNNLDALCKRYNVDNSKREVHGALLDARILADVYLAMTGGQSALALGHGNSGAARRAVKSSTAAPELPVKLKVTLASEAERAAHEQLQALLDRERRAPCLWRQIDAGPVQVAAAGEGVGAG